MRHIKYCALTTTAGSLKSFVIPAMEKLKVHNYDVTLSCANDETFKAEINGRFHYFPIDIERGFNLKKTINNIWVLYSFFKEQEFKCVEYGTENVALPASIAAFMARVPIRIYNHWGARYVGLSGVSRLASIWIERIAAFFSTDIRQVSKLNAEMCVKQHIYSAKKVKVLGKGGTIGVDFSKFDVRKKQDYRKTIMDRHSLPKEAFIFGFVGRIQRDKGINELIEAFRKIAAKDNNAFLILVGNIDNQNPIKPEEMEWAQMSDQVIFTGFSTEIPEYVSAFDVLVHPTYREGFGMVLQEAAAVKTPIITTNIMGPGEFIQNNKTGILVNSHDSQQLYSAMQKMQLNKALREKFAEKDYEFVRRYFERSVMLQGILDDREQLIKREKI